MVPDGAAGGAGGGTGGGGAGNAAVDRAGVGTPDKKKWDVIEVPFGDVEIFAEELTGAGPDVVVLDPPELRAAVVRRLRALVTVGTPGPPGPPGASP